MDSSETSYRMPWYSHLYNSMIVYDKTTPFAGNVGNGNPYPFWSSHIIGQKKYELSNHLGNVMAVVSDKVTEQGTAKRAALRAAYDYYAFGMLMPMRSVEDESIHCVPVSRTRYENVQVPLSPIAVGGIFGTATPVPVPGGGGGVTFENGPDLVSIGITNAPVALGTEFSLPSLTGNAVGVRFSFRAEVDGSFVESSLQWYNAIEKKEWNTLSTLSQGSGIFDFDLPAGVPVGAPLKVVVQTTDESYMLRLSQMDYNTVIDGLSPKPDVASGGSSAFAQSQHLPLAPAEAGVVFSRSNNSLDVQVQGSGPVPLGVELPLPALGAGGRGVQLRVMGSSSGEAALRGSLQQYDPRANRWQEIRSATTANNGGALSVDVPGGIPQGVPLKFVVTMDAGSYLHLGQMSYGEYASGEVAHPEVNGGNSSAFASATNLNLAPVPEDVSVDAGADYVYLYAGNGVAVPMGLEMSLPVVSNGATGASLSFNVDNGGGEATASLQAQVNGTWQELSSSLVVAGGTAQLDVLDWALPAGTPLKVVAFTNAGVDMGVSELVYYTVTKAVQTYMALSCDTDAAWNDGYRWAFNGKERIDEVAGKGNWQDYGMRMYDSRLARFPIPDPLTASYPELSPYQYASLNPIQNIDIDGLEGGDANAAVVAPSTLGATRVATQTTQEVSKRIFVNSAGKLVTKTPWITKALPWLGRLTGAFGFVLASAPLAAGTVTAQREAYSKFERNLAIRVGVQGAIKKVDEDANNPYITLYRGVHANHPDLPNARVGKAVPHGGDATPEQHNGGNFESIYTSWSLSKGVAQYQANKEGEGGELLEKKFKKSEVVASPDHFDELEMLVPGVVNGAKHEPAKPGGTPTAF